MPKPTYCTLVIKYGNYSNKQSQLLLYIYMSRRFSFLGLFRNSWPGTRPLITPMSLGMGFQGSKPADGKKHHVSACSQGQAESRLLLAARKSCDPESSRSPVLCPPPSAQAHRFERRWCRCGRSAASAASPLLLKQHQFWTHPGPD